MTFLKTHVGRIAIIALAMLLLAGCEASAPEPAPIEEPVVEQPVEPIIPAPVTPDPVPAPQPAPVVPLPIVVTPVPGCVPKFEVAVNGGSVPEVLRDKDKVVASFVACPSDREDEASQKLAHGGAAPGQGHATVTAQVRKDFSLPRDVSRFGSNAVDLSGTQLDPDELILGRKPFKTERRDLNAFEFHQRQWMVPEATVSFTVRVNRSKSEAQYGANISLRYVCSDQVQYEKCNFGLRIPVLILGAARQISPFYVSVLVKQQRLPTLAEAGGDIPAFIKEIKATNAYKNYGEGAIF